MKWKDRENELRRLRNKHGRDRSAAYSFPSLLVESSKRYPSLSDGFAKIPGKREELAAPENLIVDNLHKQGPMVIFRSELHYSGGKKI
jgi:hypothetical protein